MLSLRSKNVVLCGTDPVIPEIIKKTGHFTSDSGKKKNSDSKRVATARSLKQSYKSTVTYFYSIDAFNSSLIYSFISIHYVSRNFRISKYITATAAHHFSRHVGVWPIIANFMGPTKDLNVLHAILGIFTIFLLKE